MSLTHRQGELAVHRRSASGRTQCDHLRAGASISTRMRDALIHLPHATNWQSKELTPQACASGQAALNFPASIVALLVAYLRSLDSTDQRHHAGTLTLLRLLEGVGKFVTDYREGTYVTLVSGSVWQRSQGNPAWSGVSPRLANLIQSQTLLRSVERSV